MRTFDQANLDELTLQARENPRRRKNLNIHSSDEARCHRLFNAIEPCSYVAPHRHLDPEKDELFYLVRGEMGVVTFSEAGDILETVLLKAGGETFAADIPAGTFHTAVSLVPGTIFFEAKGGPYRPLAAGEKAPWAPADGDPDGASYLARLKSLFAAR